MSERVTRLKLPALPALKLPQHAEYSAILAWHQLQCPNVEGPRKSTRHELRSRRMENLKPTKLLLYLLRPCTMYTESILRPCTLHPYTHPPPWYTAPL